MSQFVTLTFSDDKNMVLQITQTEWRRVFALSLHAHNPVSSDKIFGRI